MSDEQPATNLDTPTEVSAIQEQDASSTMPPKPSTLTLILAATPSLGIGHCGFLPWPQLKKEMGFFTRITKRTSPPAASNGCRKVNAVLMGRKTWESIPPKFRPLKDRLNVVITSKPDEFASTLDAATEVEGPIVCSGILDAIAQLEREDKSGLPSTDLEVDGIFVMGGASIYKAALELPQTKRVLLTKIEHEYECDTFFSVNLDEATMWRNASTEETREFTGEEISEDGIEEQGVRFRICMYERE